MASMLSVVLVSLVLQTTPSAENFASLASQARSEYWNGNFAQAERLFREALRIVPQEPKIERARILTDLGDVLVNEDHLMDAERAYIESLGTYRKVKDKPMTVRVLRNLGAVYSLQRRDDEALSVLRDAIKEARRAGILDGALHGQILNSLGVTYYRKGKLKDAEEAFNRAVETLPDNNALYARADLLNNLAAIYQARHEYKKAEDYYFRALKLTEEQIGTAHPDLTFTLSSLALLYTVTGNYSAAEANYRRAIDILDGSASLQTRVARLLDGLSRTYLAAGRKADAEATLARAAEIAERNAEGHPDMALIIDTYASALRTAGKVEQAEVFRGRARRARMESGLVVKAQNPF